MLNGHRDQRVPGLVNVSIPGVEGESLITGLSGLALSSGSACSSATREPSYVLRSLGRSTELAQSSLRLSLGRFTTAAEVDAAATDIQAEVLRLRTLAGTAEPESAPAAAHGTLATRGPAGSLLHTLNPLAQRYFLAAPRIPAFPEGNAPPEVRHGRSGRQSDGTAVFFELHIADGIVRSARFSAYGCPHTVAVVAWVSEVLEGRRLAAGQPGTPSEWARQFDVPVEKLGRLLIIEDALRDAFTG
jgi:cysteine desulfurase